MFLPGTPPSRIANAAAANDPMPPPDQMEGVAVSVLVHVIESSEKRTASSGYQRPCTADGSVRPPQARLNAAAEQQLVAPLRRWSTRRLEPYQPQTSRPSQACWRS